MVDFVQPIAEWAAGTMELVGIAVITLIALPSNWQGSGAVDRRLRV